MSDKLFATGIKITKYDFNNGEFIMKLGIKKDLFIEFLLKYVNNAGYVDIDIKQSKKTGEWYGELNTFKKNIEHYQV